MIEQQASRLEDMSPKGRLKVMIDNDNDIYLEVVDNAGEKIGLEFCCPGIGGGGSPRTHAKLKELIQAMLDDNQDASSQARAFDLGGASS